MSWSKLPLLKFLWVDWTESGLVYMSFYYSQQWPLVHIDSWWKYLWGLFIVWLQKACVYAFSTLLFYRQQQLFDYWLIWMLFSLDSPIHHLTVYKMFLKKQRRKIPFTIFSKPMVMLSICLFCLANSPKSKYIKFSKKEEQITEMIDQLIIVALIVYTALIWNLPVHFSVTY